MMKTTSITRRFKRPAAVAHRIPAGQPRIMPRLMAMAAAGLILLGVMSQLEAKKPDNGPPGNPPATGNPTNNATLIGDSSGKSVTKYHLSEWAVKGDYSIVGPTVMVIDGDFDIGNHTIEIAATGSLELYVGGHITASGNGAINNKGVPSQLLVFGTHPEKQPTESPDYTFTLSGNGALTGVVYAPNAEYRTNGGGNAGHTSGSVVALEIRFNGSPGPFHFDEALQDLDLGFGGYTLRSYQLKPNGQLTVSTELQPLFDAQDYALLFDQLF